MVQRINVSGVIEIKNESVKYIIHNDINIQNLTDTLYRLLTNNLINSGSATPVIIINNNINVTATQSVVNYYQYQWSGSFTLQSVTQITYLQLYAVFYEGSNTYYTLLSTASANIILQPGTYTITWTINVSDSSNIFAYAMYLSLQNNLSSVSVSYQVNGSSASGEILEIYPFISFVVIGGQYSSSVVISNYGFTVTYTPKSGSAIQAGFTGYVDITLNVPGANFVEFVSFYIL